MTTHQGQQRAYKEVQRLTGRLSQARWSKDKQEQALIPALEDELTDARIVLAFERGMAGLVHKGGPNKLSREQMNHLFDYIRNREGHLE